MDTPDPSAVATAKAGALAARTLELAAELVADAARRSDEHWDGAAGAAAQAAALARRAVAIGLRNEDSYRAATVALHGDLASDRPPTRDHLLGAALQRAAEPPLALAQAAADTADLGAHVADHAPGPAAADAIAAAAVAAGVARGAAHLVAVNLATRSGDERLADARRAVRRAAAALPREGYT